MIPKDIYICYKNLQQLEEYSQIWKELNPEYTLHLYDDQMCIDFLEKEYSPLHAEIFKYISDGPIKADFWRVCILYRYGGLYVDADIEPIIPLRNYIDNTADFISCFCFEYRTMINPQFLMTYSGDIILNKCIDTYIKYYNEKKRYDYWDWSIVYIMKNILNSICIDEKYYKNYLFIYNNKKYQFLQVIDYYSNCSYYRFCIYNNNIKVFNNYFKDYDHCNHKFKNIKYLSIPKLIHIILPINNTFDNDKIINIETNWKQFYSNWDFKLWHFNDMNQFIYQKFIKYHRAFHSCLNKIDIFKYFVLYEYGGILSNIDFICNKNYENEFNSDKVIILYNTLNASTLVIISPKKHIFWEYIFEYIFDTSLLEYINIDILNIIEIAKIHSTYCIIKNINEC